MIERRPFELATPAGWSLHGRVHLPARPGPRPCVVVCHGFKGFMDWGFFPFLADLLADRGLTTVCFNFSGSGMRPGDELVSDPEAFRIATVSRDLEDLEAVLEACGTAIAPGRVDRQRMGLFGHSRGGGTALLATARPRTPPLRALVTWAAVGTFNRFTPEQIDSWRRQGFLTVPNTRTGQELELSLAVLDDLLERQEAYDLAAAARRRSAPWLIVHGEADETVPVAEANGLFEAAVEPRELVVVPGASHTFDAVHPFNGPNPSLTRALNATQTWFRTHLGQADDRG